MIDHETSTRLRKEQFARIMRYHQNPCPYQTQYAVLYEEQGQARICHPDPHFVAQLMQGGVICDMRQNGTLDEKGTPRMEGTGKVLPPLTEEEAVQYVAWRDVPAHVNRVEIILRSAIPTDRTFRNAWVMNGESNGRAAA